MRTYHRECTLATMLETGSTIWSGFTMGPLLVFTTANILTVLVSNGMTRQSTSLMGGLSCTVPSAHTPTIRRKATKFTTQQCSTTVTKASYGTQLNQPTIIGLTPILLPSLPSSHPLNRLRPNPLRTSLRGSTLLATGVTSAIQTLTHGKKRCHTLVSSASTLAPTVLASSI